MPTFRERLSSAWGAIRGYEATPIQGEVSMADPFRLWGGKDPVVPYNPSELIMKRGMRTLDEMRREEQIKAALTFKKHAVIASGWEVVSPEDQPDDWEPTVFMREQLEELPGTMNQSLIEILTAMDFGFSVTEKIYEFEDGRIELEGLKTRKPHPFDFKQDEFGNVIALQQQQTSGWVDLPIDKFLVYTYQREFDNPYGRSDLESAYRAWWAKNNSYKWMLMYLERFGIPPIFGMYNSNVMQGTVLNNLKDIMKNIQAATVGLIPRGDSKEDLEFWSPNETNNRVAEVFVAALDKFDKDMARAILMPGLLGVTPEEAVGSQARANVVFDVFMFVVNHERVMLEQKINECIVRPLTRLNFLGDEYPEWRLLPISDDDLVEYFRAWKELIQAGVVQKGEDDEAHIRTGLKMPEYTEMPQDPMDNPGGDLPMDGYPPEIPEAPMDGMFTHYALNRSPTQYERVVNFTQIERSLNTLEANLVDDVKLTLETSQETIIQRLSRTGAEGFDIDSLPGLPALKRSFGKFLMSAFEQGRVQLRSELPSRNNDANTIPRDAISFLRMKAIQLAATKDKEIINGVRQALVSGIQNGETTGQIQQRIRDVFLPHIGDPNVIKDDAAAAPHRTEAIARTESTAAFNQGRLVEAHANAQIMRGLQYSAILDGRTTPVCQSLDGKIFRLNDPMLNSLRPPRHVNCRSILVPVTISQTVDEADFIRPSEAGRAQELSGQGF